MGEISQAFLSEPALTFEEIQLRTAAAGSYVAAGLNRLALMGQLIHDLPAGVYRWRQIMPVALSLEQVGPESPETEAARELVGKAKIASDKEQKEGLRALAGKVEGRTVEAVLDADGRIIRGKCTCSHHYQFGSRKGPCRHLQALRLVAQGKPKKTSLDQWFKNLWVSKN